MTTFGHYARYYNLLYRDKDYAAEVEFVLGILQKHGCAPRTLLDLGCGTGHHAVEMAKQGVQATGVDMSETMLGMGQDSISALSSLEFSVPLPELLQGDARTVRLGKHFDAVVSLFHVMSYQNTEEDALAVLETAKEHLKPGGLFFFDFWHGPGVLTDLPTAREKIMEDAELRVLRKATPVHRVSDNVVEVHYAVTLTDKATGGETALNECHSMRYWFLPELRYLAKQAGFQVMQASGWMHEAPPGLADWNAWMLAGL
ncbi:MAG: class I SAM-dependent methyltransferase [Deltaproteobacteria bacterium]|jgi:SAM-dependent methyltransferase|nr:class I SAM-dependent methyltransferase [Deltaproteobacteria bacterium]